MKRRNFITASVLVSTASIVNASPLSFTNEPQKPFIVKAGKSRFADAEYQTGLKVSGKDNGGQFCLFESKNESGPHPGPPLHVHKYQDEVFQIIEGDYLFQVGDERIKESAGDIVFGPRTVPHTFYQLSRKAHMIFSYNPAGKMEDIMNAMAKLMPQNPDAFAKVCADNDVPFVGPPVKID
jgi:mannose-6-phosphate isomerase-like protein (cupin superfamily)